MTTPARPERPAMPPVIPGRCDTSNPVCGAEARLYAAGWRRAAHQPRTQLTEPTRKDTTQ